MKKNRVIQIITVALMLASVYSCEKDSPEGEGFSALNSKGFFIVNEGNFNSGNSSMSFYSYDSARVYNDIFYLANKRPLGDVANSAYATEDYLYIVVNNSGKIEISDIETLGSVSTIGGLISPRYFGFINKTKAYVSSLTCDSITIINPESLLITGYIDLSMSSEHILISGNRAIVTNWAGERNITVIDTDMDTIIRTISLAPEPGRVVFDVNGDAWVLCSGGYLNEEYPELFRIDLESGNILQRYIFEKKTESPTELCIDRSGNTIYFLNNDIYMMSVNDLSLPLSPLVEAGEKNFYRMDFDKNNNVLLVTDAMDFMQNGYVYGFSPQGDELFSFNAGIIPGTFCFKDVNNIK